MASGRVFMSWMPPMSFSSFSISRLNLRCSFLLRLSRPASCWALMSLRRLLEHRQRLFQVDDVDLVAMAENEGGHLGVPEAGLVTEMDTGFQHFTQGDGHGIAPKVRSEILSDNRPLWRRRHLVGTDLRILHGKIPQSLRIIAPGISLTDTTCSAP